jgi:two-component system, response regulator YesN
MKPKSKSGGTRLVPRRHGRPTVLVVDDEPMIHDLLKAILNASPRCRVIAAETGEQGLKLAEHHKVVAVVSDLYRHGMSGFEFLKISKRAHPDVPVIILSSMLTAACKRRAYRLGAFRCLLKPTTADAIRRAVRDALEHRMARKDRAEVAFPPD